MRINNLVKKALSILVCAALLLSYLPAGIIRVQAAAPVYVQNTKKADPHTIDWENFFGPNKMDTEFAGGVWTDKSVFAANSNLLSGITLENSDNFLIALSALGSSLSITGHTSMPTDTMLVLDVSGSMVDDTYSVGNVRRGNGYRQVDGVDMSMINNMVTATNSAIAALMEQNLSNRVGVVLYSGNTSSNAAADSSTATVVLPLGRYAGDSFLTVNATETTEMTYTYNNWTRRWTEAGQVTYVAEGTNISVAVKEGLKTETGSNVATASKQVNGGTYIQNGLYLAMNQFLNVDDVTVPDGAQAGKKKIPVLVLMSDGAPTIATTDYTNIQESDTGNGTGTNNRITFLTQATAAYVRGKVTEHYNNDALFLTLGLGTESSAAATDTLYPAGSGTTLTNAWRTYLATADGANVTLSLNENVTVKRSGFVTAMNYVDKYFYASDADDLVASFEDVVGEIALKTASYATLIEGGNANYSGYVTFEDELGQLMHVHKMSGIRIGNRVYTGEELARAMNDGTLGTVNGPLALGDELVATVKERIPGLDTTSAQQLVDHAYNDHQLYHDGTNWSNYIGWYADQYGNYAGFWDKDSGYENAPQGVIYANRSYGYLGENQNGDMMHVVVMVRTDLRTLHQTVVFKIPASLLPLVQYKVTLAADDPNTVEDFARVGAEPMQLVYEVGLRSDINAVNLDAKIAEHLQKDAENGVHTHVHRNQDGSVTLFTNQWKADNDTNGNGIVDANEIEDAQVAESHFHPALDNSRYYYTEDTLLRNADGTPVTGSAHPTGTGYIHYRSIYSTTGKVDVSMPVSGDTLESALRYDANEDRWYIVAGTMYHELGQFRSAKTENLTGTLDYSDNPAVFENGEKQDVYNFMGNNGTVTIAPATGFTLRKQVDGIIEGVDSYTFHITVPANVTPVLTDANGDSMTGMTALGNQRYSVTIAKDVTAYITGIPTGTQVQIEEIIGQNEDYYVKSVTGATFANGVATVVVPAANANGGVLAPVVFTNAPYTYGDLIISKEVVHNLSSDPEAMAGKSFTFRVKVSGDRISAGDTFLTGAGRTLTVGADGYLTLEGGAAITLKNDESITILGLPVGTAYTVIEENLPGFEIDSVNGDSNAFQAAGFIITDGENRADFINRYPSTFSPVDVPINLNVTKVLTENSSYTGDRSFTFQLGRYNGQDYDFVQDIVVEAGETEQVLVPLSFDTLGTYYFQIIEKPHDTPVNGMSYSTMRALFRVVVTDVQMDGTLEAKIEAVANVTLDTTGTTPAIAATFTNIYQVDATVATLQVQKHLDNDTGVEKSTSGFRYIMTPDASVQGNLASGEPLTVTSSAQGLATFSVLLTAEGTYTYRVKEQVPPGAMLDGVSGKYMLNGMYYDGTEYVYEVTAQVDTNGDLRVEAESLTVGGVSVTDKIARFTNEYILDSATVRLPYEKTLNGRPANNGETFTGLLQQTDSDYQPLAGKQPQPITMVPGEEGVTELEFKVAGTYHYSFTEEAPNGPIYKGVHYDPAVYHITIQVTDNGAGALQAQAVIHKLGVTASVPSMDFVNEYRVTGEQTVIIKGNKTLHNQSSVVDRFLFADEFEMGLYTDAACTDLWKKASVLADGSFAFSAITYTADQLGTYTYYVKEIDGNLGGVTYDDTVHTVTVRVYHEDGVLKTEVSANHDDVQVNNTYAAEGVDVVLPGQKVLTGDWSKVETANKTFKFYLYTADKNFVITNDTPIQTKQIVGAGDFTMGLRYEDGQEGFYYFVMKEDTSAQAGGVAYDAGEYHITVNVSDSGKGKLTALLSMYRPGTGNTEKAVFTNGYIPVGTTYTLVAQKFFSKVFGTDTTGVPLAMEEGQFQFLVLENGVPVSSGYNLADGTVTFNSIIYTRPGVHEYTIIEYVDESARIPGVIYDNTQFAVTVTVVDNGLGQLMTQVDNGGVDPIFHNVYSPGAAQVTISGVKEFAGDWSKVGNKNFTFSLYEADAQFNTVAQAAPHVTNQDDGSFTFTPITYTRPGTYYYVLHEQNGGAVLGGITYSSKIVHITVEVVDDGQGGLIPTVITNDQNAVITADPANIHNVTVSDVVFTNRYQPASVTLPVEAEKQYLGEEWKEFTFMLSGEGFATQEKHNDAFGKIKFEDLTFTAAGVYTLTITEQEEILWGFIKFDTNKYYLRVTVVDDGQGQLHISATDVTSDNGRKDLVFRNVHKDMIAKKDVFTTEEPTVSVDGQTIMVGQELLYQITYTNYEGTLAQVTITDRIPAGTVYVEGSANEGGVYTDGVITWVIELEDEESVTVTFKVVVESAGTLNNTAKIVALNNEYNTNTVSTKVEEPEPTPSEPTPTEPSQPNEEPPKTSDNRNPGLMMAVMLSSIACLFVLVISRKRLVG